jgi:tetratricopeptide (TPR) repeat protein
MKFILFLTLNIILALSCFAQTDKDLVALADRYEASLNENAAFETFKKVVQVNPRNYYAYWKLSELCSRIGNRRPTPKEKQDFFNAGKAYATMAIRLNPNGADGYYTLAVAMGRLALSQSGREKINSVKEIKANLEKAIRLNPNHARAWHVLGKWHYEVSNLNMFEKAAMRIVYGGLPSASIEESIRAYERSKQLDPNFALNYLELAKAYKRNDQDAKAIELLKKLPYIPNKTQDDPRIKAEGAKLLKEMTE